MADLGGLGAREGPGVNYTWTLPNIWLALLPWLLLVALLLLVKPNRCGRAWWIIAPVAGILILQNLASGIGLLPTGLDEMFAESVAALAFGLASVWLLAPWLARKHRFLTFLCILPAFAIASGITVVLQQDWTDEDVLGPMQAIVFVAFGVGVISLALFLAGCLCRRRYRPVGLTLWSLVFLAVLWFAMVMPFVVIGMLASGGELPWLEFIGGILIIVALSFALVLPFLLLSFASGFYRERLKLLFPVAEPVAPEMPAPLPTLAPVI